MPRRYRAQEIIRVLGYLGWQIARQRGSHVNMTKEGQPGLVTISLVRGEMNRGTFGSILRQAGVTRRQFEVAAQGVL